MIRFTDWLADLLHRLMAGIYSALSPIAGWIDRIGFAAHGLLDRVGVPLKAQGWVIGATWTVLVLALLWALRGQLRLLAIVVVAVVLARYFQVMPGT